MIRIALLFFMSTAATSLIAQAGGINTDRLQRYTDFLQSEVDDRKIPGCVSLIMRKGEVVQHKAIGYNNLISKEPMEVDQIFYIQSMTKPIISVAFMMLYEEGHFFLGDNVSDYLPGFDSLLVATYADGDTIPTLEPAKGSIKIWHLLSHAAGYSHGLGESRYDKAVNDLLYGQEHADISSRVAALTSYPLMGHPGEQWNYSASPDILALLIQKFSGQTPEEFLQERIFSPLGMTDTGYNLPESMASRQATLHSKLPDGRVFPAPDFNPEMSGNTVFGGTHGLFSTAEDYMKFARMILNDGSWDGTQYISRKTLELMSENFVGDMFRKGNGFGLGFGIRTDLSESEA
ncbi:MAG: serine hydrolase domain-containing protein, partial [Bacteroidota bacterium]